MCVQPRTLYGCKTATSNWQRKEIYFGEENYAHTLSSCELAKTDCMMWTRVSQTEEIFTSKHTHGTFHRHETILIKVTTILLSLRTSTLAALSNRYNHLPACCSLPNLPSFSQNPPPPCAQLAVAAAKCCSLAARLQQRCTFWLLTAFWGKKHKHLMDTIFILLNIPPQEHFVLQRRK